MTDATRDLLASQISVLRPDDVLVITLPVDADRDEVHEMADHLRERIGERFIIIAGADTLVRPAG